LKLEELTQEGLDELTSQLETEQKARVEVEAKMGEISGAIAERDSHITELELSESSLRQTIATKDSEIVTLKQGTVESVEKATALQESLNLAVSAYKTAVAQTNPAVPGELITGDTIEAVDQSLESTKSLVSTVRASIEAEIASGKVPAGAPARSAPDLESLSPREKIQYAITKGGKT